MAALAYQDTNSAERRRSVVTALAHSFPSPRFGNLCGLEIGRARLLDHRLAGIEQLEERAQRRGLLVDAHELGE